MKNKFKIGNLLISDNSPPVIIAEIGINHNGSIDAAIGIADVAIKSGAQIIKHQTHVVDDEMSEEAKKVIPGNADISIYEIIKKCALNEKDEKKLMNYVIQKKKTFTPPPPHTFQSLSKSLNNNIGDMYVVYYFFLNNSS